MLFPSGSRILHNQHGTAHGFAFTLADKGFSQSGLQVFALPGPPREVNRSGRQASINGSLTTTANLTAGS